MQVHIIRYKKVEMTVPVVVDKGTTRSPACSALIQQASLLRNFSERSISIVLIKNILPIISHEDIFSGEPLYRFGDGLSYTTFAYGGLKLPSANVKAGEPVTIEGEVKNTGSSAGDEVVELYLTPPKGFETPLRLLAGFSRIHLAAGQSSPIHITLDPRSLGQVDAEGNRLILPGEYTVSLGGRQPRNDAPTVTGTFTIAGQSELPK